MNSFHEYLKARRTESGLSVKQAADASEIGEQQWRHYEGANGGSMPKIHNIERIAKAISCSAQELLRQWFSVQLDEQSSPLLRTALLEPTANIEMLMLSAAAMKDVLIARMFQDISPRVVQPDQDVTWTDVSDLSAVQTAEIELTDAGATSLSRMVRVGPGHSVYEKYGSSREMPAGITLANVLSGSGIVYLPRGNSWESSPITTGTSLTIRLDLGAALANCGADDLKLQTMTVPAPSTMSKPGTVPSERNDWQGVYAFALEDSRLARLSVPSKLREVMHRQVRLRESA